MQREAEDARLGAEDARLAAEDARLAAIVDSLSIGRLRHHIVMCAEQSSPRCSSRQESSEVWRYLKRRLEELGLADAPPEWRGKLAGPPPPSPSGTGKGAVR